MEKRITARNELLQSIDQSWDKLTTALDRLPEEKMTASQDRQGWTVKDHIAHITVWERSVICFLQGRERYQGLGVDEATYLSRDFDKINAKIYQQTRNLSLERVLDQFRAVHSELFGFVEALTDDDLQKPYHSYLPKDSQDEDERLAVDVTYANTAGHYDEHLNWIETLVRVGSAG
jgi:hypothetical protein